MPHETPLIALISLGLVFAFGFGFLAQRLHLPPLVGYLLAGVAVGPFTPGFVADAHLASELAEIGVILLMFGVGLHFSIQDLLAVRQIALPGAVGQIAAATTIGTAVALSWGWSLGAGLVFGLSLSVASTVVLLRALEERNALDTENGRIAVGWLIVEDLATVLALVLLPVLAGPLGGEADGGASLSGGVIAGEIALTLGKVALFMALMLIGGRRLVPWLLEQVARTGSRELFTLSVLAVALGIAYGSAALFDVSLALGAFFAGVVLSESDLSHRAAADSLPMQDAFAVLFFVSVGMLFDPTIVVREPLPILAVLLVVVLGKSLAALAIVLVFGYPVSTALIVSASLAQIGEFSFILAGLGVTLGLLPPEGRDLILTGALLSITLNPLVFKAVDPLTEWLRARPRWTARLERSGHRPSLASPSEREDRLHGHALIVGYGRVGSAIGEVLSRLDLPYAIVEEDRRLVERLRAKGMSVVYGNATTPGVLEAAHVGSARLLVSAAPDGLQTRRILELARKTNPAIDTVVRTHSEAELEYLERQGVGMAILGERELAVSMMGYTLRSLGLPENEARQAVLGFRVLNDGVADPELEGTPELRP
ncbi:MAG TPA: YbaL family putative K(+) efflux transporter [Thermoanaerobaculia bacterium]|nr:YbaL family putative K(+) efflux transporter [Thermoanaerobaculia bacterium]